MPPPITVGPADIFADILDRMIRRDAGPGNIGQMLLRLQKEAADDRHLAAHWLALQQHLPLLYAGRWRQGLLRRPAWVCDPAAQPEALLRGSQAELLAQRLQKGLSQPVRLALAGGATPALIVTWDHRLCDARAILALIRHLAAGSLPDAASSRLPDLPALPRSLQQARLLRRLPSLMRPLAKMPFWLPTWRRLGPTSAQHRGQAILGTAEASALAAAQRRICGRFAESALLLAALAASLAELLGAGGQILLPLAVDLRAPTEEGCCSNCLGFIFCSVDADLARQDLAAAAQGCQASQRHWLREGGIESLLAGLRFFPWLPQTLVRREIGLGQPGLGASLLSGLSGHNILPKELAGSQVLGVDHWVAVPAHPGLAVLIHHDPRGLVIDVCAHAAVAADCPPSSLALALKQQLERLCDLP